MLLQKVAIGRPFIYFNEYGFHGLNSIAHDHFDSLYKVGIFHKSIDDLMSHFSLILKDYDASEFGGSSSTQKLSRTFFRNGSMASLKQLMP